MGVLSLGNFTGIYPRQSKNYLIDNAAQIARNVKLFSGEIRPVSRIEQRVMEAEKLGFSRIIIPHNNLKGFDTGRARIQITQARKVEEAFRLLFG